MQSQFAMEEGSTPALLVSSLSTLQEKCTAVLQQARKNFQARKDLHHYLSFFNENGIGTLFGVSSAYADCMKTLGVRTKEEFEQLWKQHSSDPGVKEAVEGMLEGEKKFAEFVAEVDNEMGNTPYEDENGCSEDPAAVGQVLPKDLHLLDATSGQPVTLDTYWKESKFTLFILIRHFG